MTHDVQPDPKPASMAADAQPDPKPEEYEEPMKLHAETENLTEEED